MPIASALLLMYPTQLSCDDPKAAVKTEQLAQVAETYTLRLLSHRPHA